MKAFDELDSLDIHWETNTWGTKHTLKDAHGDSIAEIRYNAWHASATVEAVGNRWRFLARGFFRRTVDVISVGMNERYATYAYKGRTLSLADRREFYWNQANIWGSKWVWMDADGDPVIGFQTGGMLRFKSDVRVDPENADDKSLPLLTYLGWFLLYRQREQSSTVVAVSV